MKINEIFYSVQGEGAMTGTPAIFIRFSGCNLKCDFCDTEHQHGEELTEEQLIERIKSIPCRFVVLTGGEPTIQVTENFVDKLHKEQFKVAIETNGTRVPARNIDWVTLSPKYQKPVINTCNELKVVYEGQDMEQYADITAQVKYVQPCYRKDTKKNAENIEKVINYVKENPQWKISLQTQKILKVQ